MPDVSSRFPELAVVERSGFTESRHFGTMVGLTASGEIAFALGDPTSAVLPRSSIKPWQAVGCRDAGLHLDPEQTAISAGSHTGEDAHVAVVSKILTAAGLTPAALACPPDRPEDEPTRHRLIAEGVGPERVRMNCSGKHAAMLAACVLRGWSTSDYLEPAHPLQELVRAAIERETGGPVTHVAVDGCGAPLFGTTMLGLARAGRGLVTATMGSNARTVADAMRAAPFFVGGTGHANTESMRRMPGVVAKGGAEGVIVAAAAAGQAVAVKVVDGSPRATTMLAIAALSHLGVDTTGAGDLSEVPVLGGGHPVGRILLGSDLAEALADLR